jgi:hypothetical protein
MSQLLNRMIAGWLDEAAEVVSRQGADQGYVRAYMQAASSVRHWPISMAVMYQHRGVKGLEEVPGIGPHIARVIRELLMHHRLPSLAALLAIAEEPETATKARPVLHTRRGSRLYTALYSNTERAHRFGRSRDWVVLYARDAAGERRYTVITATHGVLRGHRVVAGHERECRVVDRHAA